MSQKHISMWQAVLVAWGTVLVTTAAMATEYEWLPSEGTPGVGGPVFATATWGPDGPGPASELLIAGGGFASAGGVACNCIARWDGSAWQPLGSGMNNEVYALTVYNGELIAGGRVHDRRRRDLQPYRPLERQRLAATGDGDGQLGLGPDGLQRRVDRGRLLHDRRRPDVQLHRPLERQRLAAAGIGGERLCVRPGGLQQLVDRGGFVHDRRRRDVQQHRPLER
jgi:hypothetical protein